MKNHIIYKIQVICNQWKNGNDVRMFDYNNQSQSNNDFQCLKFILSLPKSGKQMFYFFHEQMITKKIEIQRRYQFLSDIARNENKNYKKFKLLCGIKVINKKKENGKESIFMKVFEAKDIPTKEGYTEIRELELPYLVIRSFYKGYQLKQNQIIKLGKVQYKIEEIQNNPDKQVFLNNLEQDQILRINTNNEVQKEKDQQSSSQINCRICLTNHQTQDNMLINSCKCSGSAGYMHIECLKQWISYKTASVREQKGEDQYMGGVFYCDKLQCQVCKSKLPKLIKINGKDYSLMNFIQEVQPYIALKKINKEQKLNIEQPIFITTNQQKKITIGRLYDNGVIIDDISVSRKHCFLKHNSDKGFMIQDQQSKFGTLVYEKEAKIHLTNKRKAFQINNTIFAFRLVENDDCQTNQILSR